MVCDVWFVVYVLWCVVWVSRTRGTCLDPSLEGRFEATKLPWREAGPPNHNDDQVDLDQQVVNKKTVSLPHRRKLRFRV